MNYKNLIQAAKRWKIPIETAEIVIKRDTACVYCGCEFDDNVRAKKASWEHIVNDITLSSPENIALCCIGCNASKGAKTLEDWLESKSAKSKGVFYPKHLLQN